MPVEMLRLNQFNGGAMREKILKQRGVFVIPLLQRCGVAAEGFLRRHMVGRGFADGS
jgi:hypothetical protein